MTVSTTIIKNFHNGNASTTNFAYQFKILEDTDLLVIIRTNSTGAETTKTLSTHYTVAGAGDASGGSITFTSGNVPASGETVVIRRNVPQTQAIDYIANDPFPAETHEEGLDRGTMVAQQVSEESDRSLKLSKTNTMTSTEFTVGATERANKILAFDASGELAVTQELGTFKGNSATTTTAVYAVRDIVKATTTAQLNNVYICIKTSPIGTALTNTTYWSLLVDAVSAASSATASANSATAASNSATASANSETASANSATAAASSASTASTQATNSSNSATASANSASAAAATFDLFDDSFLGAKSSNPTVDNDGNALKDGALYFNTTDDVMKVYNVSNTTWLQLTPTVSNQNNINSAVANASNINAAVANASNITSVAGNASNINSAVSNASNINTVAGISSNVSSVAGIASAVSAVNSNSSNINAVNSNASNINTLAGISSNVTTVAGISSNVTTVSGMSTAINTVNSNSSNVNTVAGISSAVSNVSGISSAVSAVNSNSSNINTVAGAISNVNNVGGSIASVNNVSGIKTEVVAVAGDATDIGLVASNIGNVAAVGSDLANNFSHIQDNGSIANAVSSSSGTSLVKEVADDIANVNLVGGSIANVNLTGGSIANVNTTAANIASVNSFAVRYRIVSSNPTSSLDAGDLAFVTGDSNLKFYNGSAWVAISPGIANVVDDTSPQLGGALDGQNNNLSNIGTINGSNLQLDFGGL